MLGYLCFQQAFQPFLSPFPGYLGDSLFPVYRAFTSVKECHLIMGILVIECAAVFK